MRFDHGGHHRERGRASMGRFMRAAFHTMAQGPFDDDPFGGGAFDRGPFDGGGRGGGGSGRGPFGRGSFGGGRRGRMFGGGELRLLLLHLLGEGDRHGYDLIKAIEELTGGQYAPSPGVVYPTLNLLVDEGLIVEAPGSGARKAFRLTDEGRAEAARRADEVQRIRDRLAALAALRGREVSPPVMRAMSNLKLALRQRAAAGLEGDIAHQIADILDEAARRIERL